MVDFFKYFTEDPLRILYFIGGSGGLAYWYDRYRNRPRIKVSLREYGLFPKLNANKVFIIFEAENLGTIPISLGPKVIIKGFMPPREIKMTDRKLTRVSYSYEIKSLDRNLPSHTPKLFEAVRDNIDGLLFLWFITYTFTPTRGKLQKIRIRNANGYQLSYLEYIWELANRFLFKRIKSEKTYNGENQERS